MTKIQAILVSAALATITTGASADYWEDSMSGQPYAAGTTAPQAAAATGTWTGGYLGFNIGSVAAQASAGGYYSGISSFTEFGIYGGYLYDVGSVVLGGEISYDSLYYNGAYDGSITTLKGRLGYDAGAILPYFVLGVTNLRESGLSTSGAMGGIGLDYKITEAFLLGAEYVGYGFSDAFGSGADLTLGSLALRLTYKF